MDEQELPNDQDSIPDRGRSGRVAEVFVDIDSEVDSVWRALTTDDGLAGWMGTGSSIGCEPGDALDFEDTATGTRRRGVVERVDVGRSLTYTWWPEGDSATATRVAITLEPGSDGTRVTVRETAPSAPVVLSASNSAARRSITAGLASSWQWRLALLTVAVPTLSLAVRS